MVTASVSVVTADDLVTSGQTTLVDALENLAGLHFRSSSGNAAQAEISMRGFGENPFGRVLLLLDGNLPLHGEAQVGIPAAGGKGQEPLWLSYTF
jgi:outer membrane receptor for ferrienterochelin and colicin